MSKLSTLISVTFFLAHCGAPSEEGVQPRTIRTNGGSPIQGNSKKPGPYDIEISGNVYVGMNNSSTVQLPDPYSGACPAHPIEWSLSSLSEQTPSGLELVETDPCRPTLNLTEGFDESVGALVIGTTSLDNGQSLRFKGNVYLRLPPVIDTVDLDLNDSSYTVDNENPNDYFFGSAKRLRVKTLYYSNGGIWKSSWVDPVSNSEKRKTPRAFKIPISTSDSHGITNDFTVTASCTLFVNEERSLIGYNDPEQTHCPVTFTTVNASEINFEFKGSRENDGLFYLNPYFKRNGNWVDNNNTFLDIVVNIQSGGGETEQRIGIVKMGITPYQP